MTETATTPTMTPIATPTLPPVDRPDSMFGLDDLRGVPSTVELGLKASNVQMSSASLSAGFVQLGYVVLEMNPDLPS